MQIAFGRAGSSPFFQRFSLACQQRNADKSKTNGFPVPVPVFLLFFLANNENYFSYLIAAAGEGLEREHVAKYQSQSASQMPH